MTIAPDFFDTEPRNWRARLAVSVEVMKELSRYSDPQEMHAVFMRRMVADALTKGGHEVIGEAANGSEALQQYQELRPEVTTLDITMPEKDGVTTLREIMFFDPEARVVMCSALGQESKVLEAIRAGAKDFVVKPFEAERLQTAVEKALS